MNKAQTLFIATSWIFIVLASLLFLIPNPFPSSEGAAWTCLVTGIFSHLSLLIAIVYDGRPSANPPPEG